jgi:hypothetical protein
MTAPPPLCSISDVHHESRRGWAFSGIQKRYDMSFIIPFASFRTARHAAIAAARNSVSGSRDSITGRTTVRS